jgi:hypothetical protein
MLASGLCPDGLYFLGISRDEMDDNHCSTIASIERREIDNWMVSICQRKSISPCKFDNISITSVGAGCSNVPVM